MLKGHTFLCTFFFFFSSLLILRFLPSLHGRRGDGGLWWVVAGRPMVGYSNRQSMVVGHGIAGDEWPANRKDKKSWKNRGPLLSFSFSKYWSIIGSQNLRGRMIGGWGSCSMGVEPRMAALVAKKRRKRGLKNKRLTEFFFSWFFIEIDGQRRCQTPWGKGT